MEHEAEVRGSLLPFPEHLERAENENKLLRA
jgi:hypothetical protein